MTWSEGNILLVRIYLSKIIATCHSFNYSLRPIVTIVIGLIRILMYRLSDILLLNSIEISRNCLENFFTLQINIKYFITADFLPSRRVNYRRGSIWSGRQIPERYSLARGSIRGVLPERYTGRGAKRRETASSSRILSSVSKSCAGRRAE